MNKTLYIASLLAMPFVMSSSPVWGIALNLVVSPETIDVGNQIDVDLVISDLGNNTPPSLGTYDIDITFDDRILDFNSAVFGDAILGNQLDLGGFGSLAEVLEPATVTVNVSELSLDFPDALDTLQPNSFSLATLTFDGIGAGTSPLAFGDVILGDAFGDPLTPVTTDSSVLVEALDSTATPEPFSIVSFLMVGL